MAIANVDLVGDSRPVVTPQAIEQLSGAFRSGFITADDIIQRVGERSRTKEALDIAQNKQALADVTDPALIQARQSQQLLAGEQAQQSRDLLPLARRATEEKLAGDIRSGQIARYSLQDKLKTLNEFGFAPAPDPEKGITADFAADVERRFNIATGWQTKKARAALALATIDAGDIVSPSGATGRGPVDKQTGAPIPEGQVQQLRKDAAETFTEYLFGITPGAVQAQPGQPTAIVQPRVAAQPSVDVSEFPPGFTQTKPAPVTEATTAGVKRTDALQRELVGLDATQAAINRARQLAVPGIVGPGQIGITRGAHQLLAALGRDVSAQTYTSQDQLNQIIADEIAEYVREWKGAISDKELRFFQAARPRIDSTTERWSSYLDEWQFKNEKLKKIVAGELAPDDPAAWAANPKSSGLLAPVSLATPSTTSPAPATPSAASVLDATRATAVPSGTVFKDAQGNWRRKL